MTTPIWTAMETVVHPRASETVGAWGFHLGAVTGQLDGVVVLFWIFAIFFGALVWYLRAQDKLEGYPLEDPTRSLRSGPAIGFPPPPPPKTFQLHATEQDGIGAVTLPRANTPPEAAARHLHPFPGSAFVPTGANPMREAIGPASYAWRTDVPLLLEGREPQIQPLRALNGDWFVQGGDADPRGLPVLGRDGAVAGHVRDLWVDRGVKILRYLEIEVTGGGCRLMPIFYADVSPKFQRVKTRTIYAEQFADGPVLRDPDRITAREEDLICAYFAGGALFADGVRSGRFGRAPTDDARPGNRGLARLFRTRSSS